MGPPPSPPAGDAGGPFAHSANAAGTRQRLVDHLEAVASLAGEFADAFGARAEAEAAGRWHDLGKFSLEFQEYLLGAEAGTRARGSGPDHKGAGSVYASERFQPLTLPISGHHGGLMDLAEMKAKVAEWTGSSVVARALAAAPQELLGSVAPAFGFTSELAFEFWVRMLFSCLVDADFLDTEAHFSPEAAGRRRAPSVTHLIEPFLAFHRALPRSPGAVGAVRREVFEGCLAAASQPPGLFRLTVPTGGGKTLSGMAFALSHAASHGLQRVIVAVPYTSITEQTAEVYRACFGGEGAVLEHHSAVEPSAVNDQTERGLWGRLAAENWDAPVVVTTTVQLFESLFARSTSKCRKLHRLCRSVIILDEAQALPTHLLTPALDALAELVRSYGSTVVLSTATQPAFETVSLPAGLPAPVEIVSGHGRHFRQLRRVRYEVSDERESWAWERVAGEMRTGPSALCVLNTVRDSLSLFEVLADPDAFYLSTRLCGAHRRRVLHEVRSALASGRACRLVSTQVVEAGVDLDFPLVLRAFGPLDAIVQAGGRCNREGLLESGRVVVFNPAEGHLPRGTYRTASDLAAQRLRAGADLHVQETYTAYFQSLYSTANLDEPHIQPSRKSLRCRTVASDFRMIRDDTMNVFVRYDGEAERLLARARHTEGLSRALVRRLQPYMVSIRRRMYEAYVRRGLVEQAREGLPIWAGAYDPRTGIVDENPVLVV